MNINKMKQVTRDERAKDDFDFKAPLRPNLPVPNWNRTPGVFGTIEDKYVVLPN